MDQQGRHVPVEHHPGGAARQGEVLFQKGLDGQQQQLVPLPLVPRAVHMDQGGGPEALGQVDLIPGRPVLDLLRAELAAEKPGVEQLPQHRQALLVPSAQGLHVPPLQPLAVQLLPELLQHLPELRGVDGLQDILGHPHAHRLTGVFKVIEAGEDYQPGSGQGDPQPPAKLQAVQEGHLDVGEHHVGPELLRQLQGLLAVGRLSHQGKAQGGPVDFPADARADLLLVVGQQDPVFLHGSALLFRLYSVYRKKARLKRRSGAKMRRTLPFFSR